MICLPVWIACTTYVPAGVGRNRASLDVFLILMSCYLRSCGREFKVELRIWKIRVSIFFTFWWIPTWSNGAPPHQRAAIGAQQTS